MSAHNHTRRERIVAAGLSLALAAATGVAALSTAPSKANAVTLDELQQQVDASNAAYNDAVDRAAELQDKISANEERISQIEAVLPEKKQAAVNSIRTMYKLQVGSQSLIDLLISAEDFNQVVSTVAYLDAVVSHNTGAIEELASLSDELVQTRSALSSQQAQVDEEIANALSSLSEAGAAYEQLEQQMAAEQAAAAAAAAETSASQSAGDATGADASADSAASTDAGTSADTGASSDSASDSTAASGSGGSSSSDTGSSSSDVETDGEWMSGLASAYSTAGGNVTASGEVLTDDSMTVAVPASQSYLLGRSVQIQYGGVTITARVTDTGGFSSYGRVLDLAGGCWKAFGFSSPNAWGVRAIRYRFV